MATEYHEHNTKQRFGSNNPELLRERKLNENICFELFVGDLYEKLPRWATKENETKSKAEQCEEPINYLFCSPRGLHHEQVKKAYF